MIVTIMNGVGDGIIEDNTIAENDPDALFGGSLAIRIGQGGSGKDWGSLVKVDLSGFSVANVLSAHFGFDIYVYYENITWYWYDVLVDWKENTSSWNNLDTGTPWNSAGCRGAETDRKVTPEGSYLVTGTNSNWQMEISPATVLKWCRESNNGIHIDTEETSLHAYIRSTESFSGNKPYFYMEYTIDNVTGFWYHNKFIHTKG